MVMFFVWGKNMVMIVGTKLHTSSTSQNWTHQRDLNSSTFYQLDQLLPNILLEHES
jgi:hypothetical protein